MNNNSVVIAAVLLLPFVSLFASNSENDYYAISRGSPNTYSGARPVLPADGKITRESIFRSNSALHNAVVAEESIPAARPSEVRAASSARVLEPAAVASLSTPRQADLGSLTKSVAFIKKQRGLLTSSQKGLPKTFAVPGNALTGNVVVDEAAGLYDTGLSIWALTEAGDLDEAHSILSLYAQASTTNRYGNMELRAAPNSNNGFAFKPMTDDAFLLFDFMKANGFNSPTWNQYAAHAGPNAWLVLAAARWIEDARKSRRSDTGPILELITKISAGLMLLQDDGSQGGVRYGPRDVYGDPYNEINSENNISAYAAFQAMHRITGHAKYAEAATKIENLLVHGDFYNPETGKMQKGMGFQTGMLGVLYKGARYNSTLRRWELQPQRAADSGGTWMISAFGAQKIDQMWGTPSESFRTWAITRQRFGRTVTTDATGKETYSGATRHAISGFDFSEDYGVENALISTEWTAGGIFALQEIMAHQKRLPTTPYAAILNRNAQADLDSMKAFVAKHSDSYATGPGLTGNRRGATGFGWTCPDESVTAMASIYATFKTDPLAWARLRS